MTIRNFSYTLDANQQVLVNRVGRTIRCTGGDTAFEVQPQTRSGDYSFDKFELLDGLGVMLEKSFDQLVITNGGTAQEIEFYVSNQEVFDSRTNLNVTGTVTTAEAGASGITTPAAVTITTSATEILSSNTTRKRAVVYNNGGAPVFLGVSGVTTADGFPLPPGQAFECRHTAAVYGVVASGTVEVRHWEENT
jgi:hypothetical protein